MTREGHVGLVTSFIDMEKILSRIGSKTNYLLSHLQQLPQMQELRLDYSLHSFQTRP